MKGYRRRIICNGQTYPSIKAAAEGMFLSASGLQSALQRGRKEDGLFHCSGIAFDAVETREKCGHVGKEVYCLDTGKRYSSILAAANDAGVRHSRLSHALHKGHKLHGKQYIFVR